MTAAPQIDICQRCVLSTNFPGLRLNEDGICQYCEQDADLEAAAERRRSLKERMELAVEDARQDDAEYECIVAFSGGKDSTFVLKLLVQEYGLKCLAVTVDNGFIADGAMENIDTVTDTLGVDHVFFKPSRRFMGNLYTKSIQGQVHVPAAIKRASDVCSSCINLINAYMLKTAIKSGAKLIAGGYLGGQVPKDSAVLDLDVDGMRASRSKSIDRYKEHFGPESERHFGLPAVANGMDNSKSRVCVINPLLTQDYVEDEIVADISTLGWSRPGDTGSHSSNCRLNDVGIIAHDRKYGFHPYAFELAEQVRKGFLDRDLALKKISTLPNVSDVTDVLEKLGLSEDDL